MGQVPIFIPIVIHTKFQKLFLKSEKYRSPTGIGVMKICTFENQARLKNQVCFNTLLQFNLNLEYLTFHTNLSLNIGTILHTKYSRQNS